MKYAIAYVERTDENGITHLEKHLMRYPQFFATKAIENKLNAGVKNGIIWHTQGSGKTALAYYNVRYLTDYYQKHGTIAKFYFIVDRLDLLTQAANEFRARGLHVEEINSKEDFIKNIHSTGTVNNTGKPTITVVNIQKFSKESIAKQSDYAVNVQRIYFLDEAHRSYKPTGSFLANLLSSDREAVEAIADVRIVIGYIHFNPIFQEQFIGGKFFCKDNRGIIQAANLIFVQRTNSSYYICNFLLQTHCQHSLMEIGELK